MSIYEDIDKEFQNFISDKSPKQEGLLKTSPDNSAYEDMEKEMAQMGFQRSNDNDSYLQALYHSAVGAAGQTLHGLADDQLYSGKPSGVSKEEWLKANENAKLAPGWEWMENIPLIRSAGKGITNVVKDIGEYGEQLDKEHFRNYTPYTAKSLMQGGARVIPSMVQLGLMTKVGLFRPNPEQEAVINASGNVIGNAAKALPVVGKYAPKIGTAASELAKSFTTGAVEASPESIMEGRDAEEGYIEEAKINGTYVKGKTEEEAKRVGQIVLGQNIPLNTLSDTVRDAAIRYIANGKGTNSTKLAKMLPILAAAGGFTETAQGIIPNEAAGKEWNWSDPDVGEAGIIGALTGIVPGAVNLGMERVANRLAEKRLADNIRNVGQGQDGSEPLTDNEQQIVNGIRNVNDNPNNPPPPPGTVAAAVDMMERNGTPSFEYTRGTRWTLNNDTVYVDNLQDVTKAGIGDISTVFMEMTGQPLIITSGTDGAGELHADGTYSHGTGYKIDVSGNGLDDPELRHAFIEYCESKGIRVLDEYEHPSPNSTGGHLDLEFHAYNGAGSIDDYSGPVNPVMPDIEMEPAAADTGMMDSDLTGQSFLTDEKGPLFSEETAKAERDSQLENLSTEELQYMMNNAERKEYEAEAAKMAQNAAKNNPYGIPTNLEQTMQAQRNVALDILRRRKVGNDIPVSRSNTSYPTRNRKQVAQQKNAATPYSKQAQDNLRTRVAGMDDATLADTYRTAKDIPTKQIIVDELQKRIDNANNAARQPSAQQEATNVPIPPKKEEEPAMAATRIAKSGQGTARQETNVYDREAGAYLVRQFADEFQGNMDGLRKVTAEAKAKTDQDFAAGKITKEEAEARKNALNHFFFQVQGELNRRGEDNNNRVQPKAQAAQQPQAQSNGWRQENQPTRQDVLDRAKEAGIKADDLPYLTGVAKKAQNGDPEAVKRMESYGKKNPEVPKALNDIINGNIGANRTANAQQNTPAQAQPAQNQKEEGSKENGKQEKLQKSEANESRNQNQNAEPEQNQERKDTNGQAAEKQSNNVKKEPPANETREEKAERLINEAFTDEDELDMAMSCFFDNMENPLQALREKRKALQEQFDELVQNAYNALAKTLPKDKNGKPTGAGVNLVRKSDDSGYIRESLNPMWYKNDYKNGEKTPYSKKNMMNTALEMVLGERKDMSDQYELLEYDASNRELRPMFEENQRMYDNIETLNAIEPKLKEIQAELDKGQKEAKSAENKKAPAKKVEGGKDNPYLNQDGEWVTSKGEKIEIADGYKTESGKDINHADSKDFIVQPNGSKDFGKITDAISKIVKDEHGEELPAGSIRLRVGNSFEGLIHAKEHENEAHEAGYSSIEDLIADVASNFTEIYKRTNKDGSVTYNLVKTGDKSKNIMNGVAPVYFELEKDNDGNYYIVITAIPKGDKPLARQIKNEHLIYRSPGLGAATAANNSAVSTQGNNNVGVTQENVPTSDSSVPTGTISQNQQESKSEASENAQDNYQRAVDWMAQNNGGSVTGLRLGINVSREEAIDLMNRMAKDGIVSEGGVDERRDFIGKSENKAENQQEQAEPEALAEKMAEAETESVEAEAEAEPEAESILQPEEVPETLREKSSAPQAKIEDFGQKIGGARKDMYISLTPGEKTARPKSEKKADDGLKDRPWLRGYDIKQGEDGKWTIIHKESEEARKRATSVSSWIIGIYGNPAKKRPVETKTYDTKEEAEHYAAIDAVSEKHRVTMRGSGENATYEIIRRIGGKQDYHWFTIKSGFKTDKEAMTYMALHPEEILKVRTSFGEADLPKPEIKGWNDARKGKAPKRLKADQNATADMFTNTFGFRGVQFGNWENQIERQSVMNAAYEGLLDLAEIMGVNPKIISLNGELGLAFGARGQGLSGAVAHYEPGYTVINLTKMKGAGSLAHEWMHALDHYLMIKGGVISNERDSKGKLTASNFNTHASDSDYQLQRCRLNGALKLAFRNLKNTAFYKDVVETKDETDALKWEGEARRRLDEELNAMRQHLANDRKYGSKKKAATEEQLKRFDELATKLAAADETYEWDWNYQTHTFPTMRKMSELYKEITGRALLKKDPSDTYKRLNYAVRNLQVRKETLADAQAKKEFTKQVPTEYSRNNTTIDRGRSTEYWTKPTEMLARAFSAFVEDSAKAKGYSTDFLSYGSDNRLIMFGKPFPEGKEREAINQAFREFFKEVQKEIAKNQEKTGEIRFSIRAAAKEQPADNTRYQAAYHGSPHVFDTFSLDHVGSGEGHQAHGYGLYFSEDKAVADNYRYMLTVDKEGSVNIGKDTYKPKDVWNNLWIVNGKYEYLDDVQNEALQLIASDNGDVNKTIAFINDVLKKQPGVKNDKEAQQFYRDLLKYIKKHKDEFSIPPGSQGQLYEVDIPDKNMLLDEQATLKNQDSDVHKKTVKAVSALSDSQKDAFFRKVLKDELEISSDALTKALDELNAVERVTLNLQRLGMWRYIPSVQAKDAIKRNLKESGYTDEQIRQFIKNRKLIDGEVERYAKEHNKEALQEKYDAEVEADNKRKDKIVSEAMKNTAKVLQDKSGRFIYDTLTEVMEGNPRKASEFLNKHGIKGITYWGNRDGRCFVVFDDKAIQIMQRYDAAVRAHGEEIKRSVDAIVKEVQDAYPSAKDVKVEGNNISFTMPNGVKLTVNIKDQIIISGKDEAKARQDHGLTDTDTGIVVEGYTRKLDHETLVVLSQESSEGTAYHEAMHTVRDYCLTEKENRDLEKYYGKKAAEQGIDVDEAIADGYRDWKLARAKGGGTLFGKLYKKMKDFIDTVKAIFNGMHDVHRIYEKIENGDIWNRDAQGRFAAKEGEAKYSAQEYSSADTSLNQTPSIFKRVQWEKGTTNIDIGGGRFDTATDYMKEQGVNNIVFDPFNRDAEHNRTALEKIKEKGDTVTVANVLNVIKEDGIRDNVILQAAKALKPDGTAYFGIYEGSGTGEGKATTKGWQNNRRTADYVAEIAKHFNDVSRKGNMIVAKEPIVIPGEKATWSMDASGENDIRYSIREKATAAAEKLANPEEVKYGSDDTGFGRVTQHIGGRQQKNLIQKGLDAWRNLYKHVVDEDTHAHKVDEAIEERTGKKLDENDSFYNNVRMAGNIAKGHAEWLIAGDEKHGETVKSRIKMETLRKQFNAKATLQNVIDTVADKVMNAKYGDFLEKHKMRDWTQVLETHLAAWRLKEMYNLHLENWRAEHEAWRKRRDAALASGEKFREKEPVYKPYKLPGNLTIQDINAAIKAAPPEVEQAAQLFYAFNKNNMILLADAGLISGENYQALMNKYKRYCPLMRDFSDTAAADEFITLLSKGGDGVANVSNPLRRISEEGSNRNLLSPLASAIKATAIYCDRAERNKVGQLAVELAEKHKLDDLIWRVPGNAADAKNCIFTVMKDGKKQAYQCLQELYEPIVGYNEDAANMVLSAMSIPARMLRIGATISPTFAIRNMIRDTFFAGIASKNGFVPVWDTIRGGIALRNDPEMRAKMEAMGVGMYTFYGNEMNAGKKLGDLQFKDPETLFDYVKGIIKNPLTGTYKVLEDFSAFSEQATRMGEFQRAIKNGKSLDEAARDARNLTIDFSRHGSLGKHVNRIIPFFNACVQGTDMMARLLLKDFPGTMMKLTKYIILPSIALWAINHDKDWWKEMDPDMKNSGWFFETPAGIVRLPKPQEAGVLFGSGVEALLDQALKRDPEAMKNWAIAFIDAIKPNVVPTVFLPLLENTANFSYFRMKPIVNRANEKLPGEQQYSNGTSELSKMLGGSAAAHAYNKGGYSPAKIDNFIRGYTGTMGMLLWQAAGEGVRKARGQESNSPAKNWQEMPFAREFFANDYNLNRSLNDFYEMASAAQAQHNGYGRKGHPTVAVQAVTKARNAIADERKEIQKITDSKRITPERKQELIAKKREKIKRIAKSALDKYRDKF